MHQNSKAVYWPDGTSVIMNNEDHRERICNLKPGVLQKTVVGAIIAKQDSRSFPDKKNPSQLRWQLNFTVRDSPFDFINVTCWGGETFVKDIANSCRIGFNVEISNVIIQTKQYTEAEEKYSPWTPSNFNIVANEPHARIALHNSADATSFASFAFLPVKDGNDYYKLGDIVANGHNLDSLHVNLLAAVRNAGCSKEIVTKSGKTIRRREVQIFDETCPCFTLTIWDSELNGLSDAWRSCETVLFLADAKVYFDEYKKRMVAVCDGKTIVTVNPDVPDAHVLYSYMQNASKMFGAQFDDQQDDGILLKDIQEIFTVDKLQMWIDESTNQCVIHGIINACVTNFNIDLPQQNENIFISRCNSCKNKIENGLELCQNMSCLNKQQNEKSVEKQLNLKMDVSDITGGLQNLRLKGNIAEKIIGLTADEIISMNDNRKTELKWKFLMERYKIYFKCSRYKDDKRRSFLDILSMQPFENQQDLNDLL